MDHHDVVIVDRAGQIVADFRIEHTAAGWQHWRQQVAAFAHGLAACVETSQGVVVEQLLESDATVYPVSPASAKRYRERKVSSGNKTDQVDAWSLADALRVDGHGWKALSPEDPLVAELRLLCRDEVELISERTALINQLQSALHEYYPAALEAFEDWTQPSAWAFVEAFPTPQALQAAGKRKWEKFLHTHKLARPETYQNRLAIFARAHEFVSGPALTNSGFLVSGFSFLVPPRDRLRSGKPESRNLKPARDSAALPTPRARAPRLAAARRASLAKDN